MALNVEKGVITAPTTTGQQTYNLPNSFAPKALILWTTDQTVADQTDPNAVMCLGMGTYEGAAVQHAYNSWWDQDGAADSSNIYGKNTTAILKTFNAAGPTVNMEVRLVSLNDGSPATFVLDYVDAPSAAVKIHYIALGGSEITAARVASFTTDIAATQDVTVASGWGQPDLLFFFSTTYAAGDSARHSYMHLGIAKNDTSAQYCLLSAAGAASFQQAGVRLSNAALAAYSVNALDGVADLSAKGSWPTDGFQLTWTNQVSQAHVVYYLALKGTFASALGQSAAPTSGTPPVVQDNGAWFPTKLAVVWGHSVSTASSETDPDVAAWWLGATDGTNEGGAAITQDDGALDMVSKRRHNVTKTIQNFDPTPTLQAEADGSFVGPYVRLSWGDIDTVARRYNWLALGDHQTQFFGAAISPLSLALTTSGDYVHQTILPDADIDGPGWTTAPLFSKVNDASDASYITATPS